MLALVVGLGIGSAVGFPMGSRSNEGELKDVRSNLNSVQREATDAKVELDAVTARESELDKREAALPKVQTGDFPKGFPKVVPVSSLPSQVRSSYEADYAKAVAIAPGVWTPLSPGSEIADAVAGGILDGFCGSIKAYERVFTPNDEHGGSCW